VFLGLLREKAPDIRNMNCIKGFFIPRDEVNFP
jgi:hypothetical protein